MTARTRKLKVLEAMSIFSEQIKEDLQASAELKRKVATSLVPEIAQAAKMIVECLQSGGKVLIMGNGGSAADAQHLAAELVGRFQLDRRAFAACALTTDTSILTSVGNDYGFDAIFSRQIEALAVSSDIVIAITTSGKSLNLIKGAEKARELGCKVIAMTGGDGNKVGELADLKIQVPSADTPRIQEAQITIGHIICRLVEGTLAGSE